MKGSLSWLRKNVAVLSLAAFIVLTAGILIFQGLSWFDSRLGGMESRISEDVSRIESRMDSMEESIDDVQSTLDQRLRTVENNQARLDERIRSVERHREQLSE